MIRRMILRVVVLIEFIIIIILASRNYNVKMKMANRIYQIEVPARYTTISSLSWEENKMILEWEE